MTTDSALQGARMADLRDFFKNGVVPPYRGAKPSERAGRSPYRVPLKAFVEITAFSPERQKILDGFLRYRSELKAKGVEGFQWVDGSFVEDVENGIRNRPPSDIDLVTWAVVPDGLDEKGMSDWFCDLMDWHQALDTKNAFQCDAYVVPIFKNGFADIDDAIYWSGLFAHSKEEDTWKGFFHVELADDEKEAMMLLSGVTK